MTIPDFQPFEGEHCETVALGNLIKHEGLELSEPMLFGIGSGLGFIYWKMKSMPLPFLGGRTKHLGRNLCENLGIKIEERETTSTTKAWKNVREFLDEGKPVAIQLDCFHLEYFTKKINFAGHHVAMYGYDSQNAYLVDTIQQGSVVQASLGNLAKARCEKGPMSARNRSVTVSLRASEIDLEHAVIRAIKANTKEFLNPPIKNLGYKGIKKTSSEIKKWYSGSTDLKGDFTHAAMMMERAGTGGALFRNLYRDFLKEAYELIGMDCLKAGYERFTGIVAKWTEVSELFIQVAEIKSDEPLMIASSLLAELSELEKTAMQNLSEALS